MRATLIGLGLVLALGPMTATPSAHAQGDVSAAKDLYVAAQKALDEGRFTDALRDFGAVYDLTKDPVLFYKLGRANEGAGKCNVAVVYYQRYIREAKPSPEFVTLAEERIASCQGSTEPAPVPVPDPDPSVVPPTEASPLPPPPPEPKPQKHVGPWLLVGGAIALITAGAVLAYSAEATESDVDDLYVQAGGLPPVFDPSTEAEYESLRDEGRRYEILSWTAFGVGAGLAIGAGVWYATTRETASTKTVMVTPTANGAVVFGRF